MHRSPARAFAVGLLLLASLGAAACGGSSGGGGGSGTPSPSSATSAYVSAAGASFVCLVPLDGTSGWFDEDGFLDLAVIDALGTSVSILLGLGDGTFQAAAPITFGLPEGARRVRTGHFDLDGRMDLVVLGDSSIRAYFGTGDGGFLPAEFAVSFGGTDASRLVVGDFDGNDYDDVLVLHDVGSGYRVFLGQPLGGLVPLPFQSLPPGSFPADADAADFAGDDTDDVVIVLRDTQVLWPLVSNGDGTFSAPLAPPLPLASPPTTVALHRVGEYGIEMVAVGTDAGVDLFEYDAQSNAFQPVAGGTFPTAGEVRSLGFLRGTNPLHPGFDLAAVTAASPALAGWRWVAGSPIDALDLPPVSPDGYPWGQVAGDFDADGDDDLVVLRVVDGTLEAFLRQGP